jgi:carbamoyltransferase
MALQGYRFKNKIEVSHVPEIEKTIAELLTRNEIVARFQGRMEFGARALGNRSILANPSNPTVVRTINEMIKCRDFWMPFAPSVLEERGDDYFIKPRRMKAPYMIITFDTKEKKRAKIGAVIHPYDYTARPQEVYEVSNPRYYKLIKYFESLTGDGIILNTSFNLHGEPVVCSPEDAFRVFDISGLKYLAIEDFLLTKK